MVVTLDPILVRLGPIDVRWLAIVWLIGLGLGVWVWIRQVDRQGLSRSQAVDVATRVVPAAVVGARLVHILANADQYVLQPGDIVPGGGFAMWGALAGGGLAAVLVCRARGLDTRALADAAAPALALGEAIGRLGCLIDGSNVGTVTAAPWAFVYPHPAAQAPDHVFPHHPTPLYHSLASIGTLGLLLGARRRALAPGTLFAWWLALHAMARLAIGSVRGEPPFLLGLQLAQWCAVIALAALGFAMIRNAIRGYARMRTVASEPRP